LVRNAHLLGFAFQCFEIIGGDGQIDEPIFFEPRGGRFLIPLDLMLQIADAVPIPALVQIEQFFFFLIVVMLYHLSHCSLPTVHCFVPVI
jgi:hypothetical protein